MKILLKSNQEKKKVQILKVEVMLVGFYNF